VGRPPRGDWTRFVGGNQAAIAPCVLTATSRINQVGDSPKEALVTQPNDQRWPPPPPGQGQRHEPVRTGGQSPLKWLAIAVVVVVVGAGAWYVWGYFNAKGQLRAINDAINGGNVSSSSTDSRTIPTLSPQGIDAQKRFDQNRDSANESVRHGLEIHGLGYGNFFNG
jgi:hypothetical protein